MHIKGVTWSPMCFSAVIQQNLDLLARQHKARIDTGLFEDLFARRAAGADIRLAKSLEANFLNPQNAAAKRIAQHIAAYQAATASKWQIELFQQKTRLADAGRKLKARTTQKALDDQRIATNKIAWLRARLADLKRTELNSNDARISPFWYAPVLVSEAGERVIRPMRYHCRPSGKPASIDSRYPGLHSAQRDNLDGFWKNQFGHHHAYCVVQSFYEIVTLHDFEKRALRPGEKAQNLVLHFNPQPASDMLVACLWDSWQKPGEPALLSFAAITDDPPPEVAATGHSRCIIPLKPGNLSAWLTTGAGLAAYYALLDDRERPYYAHELAA
jgi:putative SOS response-associated peptidase YedK